MPVPVESCETVRIPDLREASAIYGIDDRIIVKTGFEHADTMRAFDLNGEPTWSARATSVYEDAKVVVSDDLDNHKVTFLNADDGRRFAEVDTTGVYATAWSVYRGGLACSTPIMTAPTSTGPTARASVR